MRRSGWLPGGLRPGPLLQTWLERPRPRCKTPPGPAAGPAGAGRVAPRRSCGSFCQKMFRPQKRKRPQVEAPFPGPGASLLLFAPVWAAQISQKLSTAGVTREPRPPRLECPLHPRQEHCTTSGPNVSQGAQGTEGTEGAEGTLRYCRFTPCFLAVRSRQWAAVVTPVSANLLATVAAAPNLKSKNLAA